MSWCRWKIWRLAWSLNRCAAIDSGGWRWLNIGGHFMWRAGRIEPRIFRVTDGESRYSCESHYDHFVLRPEDGGEPWTTPDLSSHGLRKC